MKPLRKLGIGSIVVLVLGLISVPILGSRVFRRVAPARPDFKSSIAYLAGIRAGIGTEVRFASPTDSPEQVRQSVQSVADFIEARSGLRLTDEARVRLTTMEQETLSGSKDRIKIKGLANEVASVLVERFASLSDAEIDSALAGFTALDGHVKLRANGEHEMDPDDLRGNIKMLRSGIGRLELDVALHAMAEQEIRKKFSPLRSAVPEHFGQTAKAGLTPAQALLLTYSAVADDSLAYSNQALHQMVETSRSRFSRRTPDPGPAVAFGSHGHLYSAPVDLVLNPQTVDNLLDRISQMGVNQ